MTPWSSAAELREDVVATLERFVASPDGQAAAALARRPGRGRRCCSSCCTSRTLALHLDVAGGTVAEGLADDPAATLELAAPDLHDVLLERLGPVEISRLVEEGRLRLVGTPEALAASVVLAARVQPHYAASLRERGREDAAGDAGARRRARSGRATSRRPRSSACAGRGSGRRAPLAPRPAPSAPRQPAPGVTTPLSYA